MVVLGYENWVGRSGTKKIHIHNFFYLEKLKTKKKVLAYKYIMNSIIHCNTCYTAIQTRNNYYSTTETINIFLDHKKTGGLNTKKWVGQKT